MREFLSQILLFHCVGAFVIRPLSPFQTVVGENGRPFLRFFSSSVEHPANLDGTESEEDRRDAMRRDIEAMRREARERLASLSKEFSDYKSETLTRRSEASSSAVVKAKHTVEVKSSNGIPELSSSLLNSEHQRSASFAPKKVAPTPTKEWNYKDQVEVVHADADLLADTRWKIVFDIGREKGTWMPADWGVSGDRLRFSVVVELTDTPYYEREAFFDGVAGAKVLKVVGASMGPSFWGGQDHGERMLRLLPSGAYKVVRGVGPMGTDVVRFFIDTEEDIRQSSSSDVVCPKGRVYGNCGFFPFHSVTSKDARNGPKRTLKDVLNEEYHAMTVKLETLERESEEDTRLFSMDQLQRMKETFNLQNDMRQVEQRMIEARQRKPDRSELRPSKQEDVALSKDGGVCLKVQKGLAVEYHILGRMEVVAMDKEQGNGDTGFRELVKSLHP